jgi:energy-coupling factor transport system ATP-binding protein
MQKILEVCSLSFFYEGVRQALRSVSLSQWRGQFYVVLGRSGAGKSTLSFCIAGYLPKKGVDRMEGRLRVNGEVGVLMEDFDSQIFCTSCELEVAFGLENKALHPAIMRERVNEALKLVGLKGMERKHPGTLSGGQRQRLAIASTLALLPDFLLLDEPTTDLDPEGRKQLFSILLRLKERGISIMLFEHELEYKEGVEAVVLMDEGRLIKIDGAENLLTKPNLLLQHGIRPTQLSLIGERIGEELGFNVEEASRTLKERGYKIDERRYKRVVECRRKVYGEQIIGMEGVWFAYEGRDYVIKDVSLSIRRGEFVAIVGENGSGKTTLAKLMNGLLHPCKGIVFCHGEDTRKIPLSKLCAKIGYIFQNPDSQIFAPTVFEEVAFGPKNLGTEGVQLKDCVQKALECVGILHLAEKDPFSLTKGERQRLALASVLSMNTDVLIMDEPTTGLDWDEEKRIMKLLLQLNKEGKTVIIITHRMWFVAECAQRVILLKNGRLLLDAPTPEAFSCQKLLLDAGLHPPDVVRLSLSLGKILLTEEEFLLCIKKDVSLHRG